MLRSTAHIRGLSQLGAESYLALSLGLLFLNDRAHHWLRGDAVTPEAYNGHLAQWWMTLRKIGVLPEHCLSAPLPLLRPSTVFRVSAGSQCQCFHAEHTVPRVNLRHGVSAGLVVRRSGSGINNSSILDAAYLFWRVGRGGLLPRFNP